MQNILKVFVKNEELFSKRKHAQDENLTMVLDERKKIKQPNKK